MSQSSPPPKVTLTSGAVEGMRVGSSDNAAAFLGIPYAAAPVGDLRWKPPQAVKKWKGVRRATQYAAACPQLPARWFPNIGWNEDCLYLNVWTPKLARDGKLPVLVYFHGGSNTQGYGHMTPLGPALSPFGLVVVSANYRLGPFGFLAYPALTAESKHHSSGNYGLLDQLQVLHWVKENISHFGGDPARVTVMGQSAGAVDVCLLMASPLAAGLFHGAILESGECQSSLNEDIRKPIGYNFISTTGEDTGERLARDLGARGPVALQKLRMIPPGAILKAWSKDRKLHFDAIVDGWVIPDQPAKVFAEGRQIRIPVLVGSNLDEATVFGHNDVQTVVQYRDYLRRDSGKYWKREFDAYPVNSDSDVPSQYLRLQSDTFAYGAYSFAESMTRIGQRAFLYCFTYAEKGKRAPLGAYHGEELKILSNSLPDDSVHDPNDEKLGRAMRTYWTQFAKTGNPNAPEFPLWLDYKDHPNHCFELGRTLRSRPISNQVQMLEALMTSMLRKRFARSTLESTSTNKGVQR